MGSETALVDAIAGELEKAGAKRKPGSKNEWVMPAKDGVTATVDLAPNETTETKEKKPVAEGTVAADQLRLFVERIERLEEEKKAMSDDIRDVYSEAKANGYDTATMRRIVRLRKMETHTRQEAAALMDTYASALGIQGVLGL